MSNNEKALLLKIADGDEQAFTELYRQFVPRLEPFVRSIMKNDSLTTEVIQESFVRLWMNREKMGSVEFPKTYISRTVSYVCFDYLRRRARELRLIADLDPNEAAEPSGLRDLEQVIRDAVGRLTPSQQKIYRMSREQGLKIPEIAEQLGISPNTVKNTLVASLKSIRAYAEQSGYSLGILLFWLFA